MDSHLSDQLKAVFGTTDLYAILEVERKATFEEIKKAYKRLALKNHPDRGGDAEKFKAVSVAHCILSDEGKRSTYDESGDVDDAEGDGGGEGGEGDDFKHWYDYYRTLFPPINASMIQNFSEKYKGSDEEKEDVLECYAKYKGDMGKLMESVMLADSDDDEIRFRVIIDAAIATGEVSSYSLYQKHIAKSASATATGGGGGGGKGAAKKRQGEVDLCDEGGDGEEGSKKGKGKKGKTKTAGGGGGGTPLV